MKMAARTDFDRGWDAWNNRVKFDPIKNDEWANGWRASRDNYLRNVERKYASLLEKKKKEGFLSTGEELWMAHVESAAQSIAQRLGSA
jgi:hypothetical protein